MPDDSDNRLTATGEPRAPGRPRTPGPRKSLTPQQSIFCDHYIKEFNATQSARAAGYGGESGDLGQCAHCGWKLLQKPLIKKKIALLLLAQQERTQIDADWLLMRLVDEAEADLADLYNDDGTAKPVKEWPLIWRQGLIAGVDHAAVGEDKTVISKLRMSDRLQRLNMIGRHVDVRAFEETIKVEAGESLVEYLEEAGRRVAARKLTDEQGHIIEGEIVEESASA